MKIEIELTREEDLEMQAIAIKHGVSPAELLTSFVADLTGSLRTRGSDERMHAQEYLERAYSVHAIELTAADNEAIEDLLSEAYAARVAQLAAAKTQPPASDA